MSLRDLLPTTGAKTRKNDEHLAQTQELQIARILLKSEKAFNARKRAKWAKAASVICEKINNTLEIGIAYVNNEIERKKAICEEYEKRANVAKQYLDTTTDTTEQGKIKAEFKEYYTALDNLNKKGELSSQSDYDHKKGLLIAKLALGSISTLADIISEAFEVAAHHHGPNPGEADFTYNFLARTADIKYKSIYDTVSLQITKIDKYKYLPFVLDCPPPAPPNTGNPEYYRTLEITFKTPRSPLPQIKLAGITIPAIVVNGAPLKARYTIPAGLKSPASLSILESGGEISLEPIEVVRISNFNFDSTLDLLFLTGENLNNISKICLDNANGDEWKPFGQLGAEEAIFEKPAGLTLDKTKTTPHSIWAFFDDKTWRYIGNASI